MAVTKFLPVDWSLTDEESKAQGRITPSQERAILLALSQIGYSDGCLIADEPGFGKTTCGAEIIKRARAWRRVLLICLPDTHKQWVERINAQSEGIPDALPPRVMNGTKAGKANYDAFMKHEEGIFIASSHFLVEKDWEQRPEWHHDVVGDKVVRFPVFKRDRKTGELELVARAEGVIGPAEEPVRQMKSTRKDVFARFARKPLDAVLFDEVQVIASRKAKGRQTIYSIKAHFRVAMSGSFFLNKLENQWSVATWVWPGDDPETGEPWIIPAFQRWKDRYLLAEAVRGRGGKVLTTKYGGAITQVTGERIPGEFVSTLPAYIRREAEPVPEPLVIDVDPTPQQLAQIQDFERDLMIWAMSWTGEEAPLVADIPLVLLTRLRQAAIAELSIGEGEVVSFADDAASAKLAPLRWLLEDRWGGQPAAIYTDSKIGAHFIERRMRRAGVDARAWTGDLTKPQRDEMKHAYMAGEFPYIIATVQSFGTGLDGFQTRANKVAWISRPQGNSALVDQAIRRFWRPGMTQQGGGFEQAVLRMRDSTDFRTEEMLLAQAWANREAMNGGRLAA